MLSITFYESREVSRGENRAETNAVSIYEYNEEEHMKQFSYEICQKHKVIIRYMETDKDHIHYMIETEPTMSISKIVNLMKSYTTYHIWERYPNYLRKHFWKEHTFWTDGYFACSVGNVSEEMLRKYIENQG